MKMKRITKFLFALIFALVFTCSTYAQTLYEHKTVTPVYTGLIYEHIRRVTTNGLLDVHVLTVDLNQEHLSIQPVASKTENGLKETLTRLLEANGAVAGVNGDFFGMAGSHSMALGLEITDGIVTSAAESFNTADEPKSATLFINNDNIPFMDYIQTDLRFYNGNQEYVKLNTYNISSEWTCYLDRTTGTTTASFDARFPGRYKIVVDNDIIVNISSKGETVTIPENGYIIALSDFTASANLDKFKVGQNARVSATSSIDLTKMSMAISGGGKIISNGHYSEDGMFITGRHPRTALGITAPRDKLIMMVVDGRSHSIGATHRGLAELMWEYGVHDAMHLDGGGSSTIAVQESLKPMTVRNTPSDGSQRRIINGLGVFNRSQPSEPVAITFEISDYLFAGIPSRLYVYTLDKYLNRTEIKEGFTIDAGDGGHYANGYFSPARTGNITLTVSSGAMTTVKTLKSGELAQINAPDTVRIAAGGEHYINVSGKSSDGHTNAISLQGVNVEIVPSELAVRDTNDPNKIIAVGSGAGYIKYSVGNIQKYTLLTVGTRDVLLETFSPDGRRGRYIAHPEENAGQVGYADTSVGQRLRLTYQMSVSSATQAAYVAFDDPIGITGRPTGLKLSVYGDNSNNWLRGRITDANGEQHIFDFARVIDWEGFRTVEAKMPADMAYPVKIDRIYVAALENNDLEMRQMYLNNLTAVYPIDSGNVVLPESSKFADRKMMALGQDQQAFTDIMLLGDIVSENPTGNDKSIQDNNKAEFNTVYGETFGIFFGATDNIWARMPVFRKAVGARYNSYKLGNVDVISLTAVNGSMFSSSAEQWQKLEADLTSAGNSVLILFDKNPLTAMPAKELDLLQQLFVKTGKNIVVVSSEGTKTTTTSTDGVRYINLGSLFLANGSVNEEFRTLRVRFFEDDLRYSLK